MDEECDEKDETEKSGEPDEETEGLTGEMPALIEWSDYMKWEAVEGLVLYKKQRIIDSDWE